MTVWRLFGRGAFERPWLGTIDIPAGTSATDARDAAIGMLERDPARPSLLGMRVDAAGAPWINAGQLRGREAAEVVAAILGAAIVRRPDWVLSCRQDGQWRPFGAPLDAASLPLPIASAGLVAAHHRHAADVGGRWARAGRAS